jgi:hypothetical protein
LIDGKKTIKINHQNLKIINIKYTDEDEELNLKPIQKIFGNIITINHDSFNKMLNDPEYVEFYKKLISIILNRNECGLCIKNKATLKLECGHYVYCKNCHEEFTDYNNIYTCLFCLKNAKIINQNIIDLSGFDL